MHTIEKRKVLKAVFYPTLPFIRRSGESIYERKFSPGRPRSIDEEYLHQLVLSNPFMTTRELAKGLDCVWWCSSGLVHY